jgi:hypothetical protein
VKWWSPPKFLIVERVGDYAVVAGADYNTHTVIRGLRSERWSIVMDTTSLTHSVGEETSNEPSVVSIHLSYLEGDPPYQIPEVAPQAALAPNP